MGRFGLLVFALALLASPAIALPDLLISNVTLPAGFGPGPQSVPLGGQFAIAYFISNAGDQNASAHSLRVVFGNGTDELYNNTWGMGAVAPRETRSRVSFLACAVPGLFLINATEDVFSQVEESDEGNNGWGYEVYCGVVAGSSQGLGAQEAIPAPPGSGQSSGGGQEGGVSDLVASMNVTNSTGNGTEVYLITAVFENIGQAPSPQTHAQLTYGTQGIVIEVPPLAPGGTDVYEAIIPCSIAATPITVMADSQAEVQESDEDNNAASGVIGACTRPDLAISALSVPQGMRAGQAYPGRVSVFNSGAGRAAASALRVTIGGIEVASVAVPALAPNSEWKGDFQVQCPASGKLALVATADAGESLVESDERNNVREIGVECAGAIKPAPPATGAEQKHEGRSSGIFNSVGLGGIDDAFLDFFKWLFGG